MRNTKVIYANNRLKEFRKQAGYTQGQVSKQLNMHCESRLCRWERGISIPSVENLFKLAKLYNVIPHQFYPDLFSVGEVVLPEVIPQMPQTDLQMNVNTV